MNISKANLIKWMRGAKIRYASEFPIHLNVYLDGKFEVMRRVDVSTKELEELYSGYEMDTAIDIYMNAIK